MPGRKAPEATRRDQILKAAYEVALGKGIDGLTMRAVAARAKLSHGLVHFHFKDKAQLVSALLDRVLVTTAVLHVPAVIAHIPRAQDRLRALLRQEMDRLAKEPRRIRLFFEYWALGTRHAPTRARISAGLDRYRAAFRTMTAEMVETEPAPSAGVTAEGLAAVAVSFVNGCAMQAMIDPAHFDIEDYLAAVEGILGWADRHDSATLAAPRHDRPNALSAGGHL